MSFDVKVPAQLKKTQQWFGSIIGRPIDNDSRMNPLSPTGQSMELEAADFIAPSPTLRPAQRIQLYNQQYWWRLLNTLQECFPTVTRLFGYYDFNRTIAIPYLVKYPPKHWSLSLLGDRLGQWANEDYLADDKILVRNAIDLDWGFNYSFVAPELPPLSNGELGEASDPAHFLKKKIYTQPHLHFFSFESDLISFRFEFMKESPDYWVEHDFPELKRGNPAFYTLFRNQENEISWKEICKEEYDLLRLFQKGTTIEKACNWLDGQDAAVCAAAAENLHVWFQEWTLRKWLTTKKFSH